MNDKTTLAAADKKIVDAVSVGAHLFSSIWITTELDMRLVDRRLQSLKKRGILKYSRANHWELA
jgi:hypothetical protein